MYTVYAKGPVDKDRFLVEECDTQLQAIASAHEHYRLYKRGRYRFWIVSDEEEFEVNIGGSLTDLIRKSKAAEEAKTTPTRRD